MSNKDKKVFTKLYTKIVFISLLRGQKSVILRSQ